MVGGPGTTPPVAPTPSDAPSSSSPVPESEEPPPGPVTPTGPFALTWGGGDLDSEDAIRAAFRSLSGPSSDAGPTASDADPTASEPEPPVFEAPGPQASAPEPTAPASAAPGPAPLESAESVPLDPADSAADDSESPFAGFPSPPVARQSFTPAPGMASAEEPPVPPVVPPRHPIAPSTAPAGWDELAARPAEPDPEPVAPAPPAGGRFGAFASDTFGDDAADPFRALIEASAPRDAEPMPSWPSVAAPEPAPAAFTPSIPSENTTPRGFPFLEVRGEAAEPVSEPAGLQAESAASRRAPFPAFVAATGDRSGREPEPGEPVDDLLAALGSGTARPSRDDASGPAAGPTDAGSGAPPERGGPPTGGGFDALGFSFGDDEEDEEPDDAVDQRPARPSIRERLFGRGRDANADEDAGAEPEADAALGAPVVPPAAAPAPFAAPAAPPPAPTPAAAEPQSESPIAREIAETGYFWNLTPDPSAADPNAEGPAVADRTGSFEDEWAEPEPEPPFAVGPAQPEPGLPEPAPFLRAPQLSPEVPQLSPEEPEPVVSEPVVPEPVAPEPVAPEPIAPEAIAPEPEHVAPEPIAPEPPAERPTFTASLFAIPPATQSEPEPEPESDVDAEPSWSFGDDAADEAAGHREDAPTAMFPAPSAGPNATGSSDDDPLAALFGARPVPQEPQPIEDPWNTGSPFGASAGTSAPADRFAADAGPFAAYAASAAAPSQAPAPAVAPRPTSAPRTGGGSGGGSGSGTDTGGSGSGGGNRTVRVLAWVAGGLVAAVVLVGLFFLGTQLSGGGEASAPSATPTPTETPVAAPTAPQPAGVHPWNSLFGGECIEPFESAWAEEFTVVDCAAPHAAQLVYRGQLPGDAAAPFPGEAEIASQMNLLCTAPGVIDVAAVSGVEDLQVQAAFPVTEEQWTAGERSYYCFANRAGGEPLTASIAGPGPAA